jgi:hypothetical protein
MRGLFFLKIATQISSGQGGLLIPKARTVLGIAVLLVATAAVSALVASKWSLFPPTDYEDCAARAAKDAKSKDALSVLLSLCGSEFKGRRKPGGGFTYYDSCQHNAIDIKGPNPTPAELNDIEQQCLSYVETQEKIEVEEERRAAELAEQKRKVQQAAQEARDRQLQAAQEARAAEESTRLQELKKRQQSALRSVKISETKIECYDLGDCFFHVAVTNGSREIVNGISFGWMFPSVGDVSCPSELSTKTKEDQKLRPGETAWVLIEATDTPPYGGASPKVCIKVTSVDIAP